MLFRTCAAWSVVLGAVACLPGCGIKFSDTSAGSDSVFQFPVDLNPRDVLAWEKQAQEAASLQRVWYSYRPPDERRRFEGPFYYVQVMELSEEFLNLRRREKNSRRVHAKDVFVAPHTTLPLPQQTKNYGEAKNVVFFVARRKLQKYVDDAAPPWAAAETRDGDIELLFCVVDKAQPRRRRWISARSGAPSRISSKTGAEGSQTVVDGKAIPVRMELPELTAAAVKSFADDRADPSSEPADEADLLPLRSRRFAPGSFDTRNFAPPPTQLYVSPAGDRVAFVAVARVSLWSQSTASDRVVWEEAKFSGSGEFGGWTADGELLLHSGTFKKRTLLSLPSETSGRSFDLTRLVPNETTCAVDRPLRWCALSYYGDVSNLESPKIVLRLWSMDDFRPEAGRTLAVNDNSSYRPYFSPDSTYLVAYLIAREVNDCRWFSFLTANGKLQAEISGKGFWNEPPLFSPNGRWVGFANAEDASHKCYRFFALANGRPGAILGDWPEWPRSIVFSPSGEQAAAALGRTIELWSVAHRQKTRELTCYLGDVWSIAYSSDGTRLYSAAHNDQSGQTEILEWDVSSGEVVD